MSLSAAIPQGLSGYVAFGMRWGVRPDHPPSAGLDYQPRTPPRPTIIDVEATPVSADAKSRNSGDATQQFPSPPAARIQASPAVASYAPPTRPGQAPNLRYAAPPPGQLVDTWA